MPQSFCPAWRSVHSYPLQLTAGMVHALASLVSRPHIVHTCMHGHTACPKMRLFQGKHLVARCLDHSLCAPLPNLLYRACVWRSGTVARALQLLAAAAGRRARCFWALEPCLW